MSVEPLLGPIDFSDEDEIHGPFNRLDLGLIHWVIVGGESGPGARPCNVAWVRSIVEQCKAAEVPAFVKQLGKLSVWDGCGLVANNPPGGTFKDYIGGCEVRVLRLGDGKGGSIDEFPADLRVREFPTAATVTAPA